MIAPGDTVRMTNPANVSMWDEDDESIMFMVIGVYEKKWPFPVPRTEPPTFMQAVLLPINRNIGVVYHPVDRLAKLF